MTTKMQTIRKIRDDFLVCGICLESLSKPKCLTCLHKFCADCLEAYVSSLGVSCGSKFECPYKCKEKTVWPKTKTNGLKTDFTLQGLIEYIGQKEKEEEVKQSIASRQMAPLPPAPQKPDEDLDNLYQALWKCGGARPAPPSGVTDNNSRTGAAGSVRGQHYIRLDSVFNNSPEIPGTGTRTSQQYNRLDPFTHQGFVENNAPSAGVGNQWEAAPPTVPPKAWNQGTFQRPASEATRPGLYPTLPQSQSYDTADLGSAINTPVRRSSAPLYHSNETPPTRVQQTPYTQTQWTTFSDTARPGMPLNLPKSQSFDTTNLSSGMNTPGSRASELFYHTLKAPPTRVQQTPYTQTQWSPFSDTAIPGMHPNLPKSQSFDTTDFSSGINPPGRGASAPLYNTLEAPPRRTQQAPYTQTQVSPSGNQHSAPPAFNPYYTSRAALLPQAIPAGNNEHNGTQGTGPSRIDNFKNDIAKTLENWKKRRTSGTNKPDQINPEGMAYEDLKTVALEKSLHDKGPIRQNTISRYQPADLDDEEAYSIGKNESRWHKAHEMRSNYSGVDDYTMYSLGKQMSLQDQREERSFTDITLHQIVSVEHIDQLNSEQLQYILATNAVECSNGSMYELQSKVQTLWESHKNQSRAPVTNGNNTNMYTYDYAYDDVTPAFQPPRQSVTSDRYASADSPMARPIRSAVQMRLPEIPVGEETTNRKSNTPDRSSHPFLRQPISDRPLPDVPSESNAPPLVLLRSNSSKSYSDRFSITAEEPEYCSTEELMESLQPPPTKPRPVVGAKPKPTQTPRTPPTNTSRPTEEPPPPPPYRDRPPPPPYVKTPPVPPERNSSQPEYMSLEEPPQEEITPERENPVGNEDNSVPKDPVASLAEALKGALIKKESLKKQNICPECKEPIAKGSRHTLVLDQKYHVTCFRCKNCDKIIDGASHEEPEFPTCPTCYKQACANGCDKCKKPIKVRVTWDGKTFHTNCFTCSSCDKLLQGKKVYKESGKPYCIDCYTQEFASICIRCKKPVLGTVTRMSKNRSYHNDCVTCVSCGAKLSGLRIYSKGKGDDITCNSCYK